jgi:beta-glucosidase
MPLDFRAFAYYHPGYQQWITEDGTFDILIGASSEDIRHAVKVTLQSTLDLPSILTSTSTLQQWLDDPRGKQVFGPLFQKILNAMRAAFGGGEAQDEEPSMEAMAYLMSLPLRDVLEFPGALADGSPDEIVDGLLRQVQS